MVKTFLYMRSALGRISIQGYLLCVVLLFICTVNAAWLKIDHRPPRWDESSNLYNAERAYQLILQGKILEALNTQGQPRPNFIPFLSALTFFIFGNSTKLSIFLLNTVSILVISLSLYGIGKILFDRNVGLLACVMFNFLPSVSIWSHYYNLDLPLTAFVTLTILLCILIDKNDYQYNWQAILLGLVVGMGICAKHLYSPFVAFPLFFLFILSLTASNFQIKTALNNNMFLYISLSIALVVGITYHIGINYDAFYDGLMRTFSTEKSVLGTVGFSSISFLRTARDFYDWQLDNQLLYVVLFLTGLVFALFNFKRLHIFLYAWIFGICISLFLVIRVTLPYYFFPIMPAFLLVSAAWLERWKRI